MPLTAEQFAAIRKREAFVLAAGVLSYIDVFGKQRRLIFRMYNEPVSENGGTVSLYPANRNNQSN